MTTTSTPRTLQISSIPIEELLEKLDKQYETYLHLLHQYTEARTHLSKQMSNGFLALAQANFSTQNRMRYGRDQYDERMRAQRVVDIEQSEDDISFQLVEPAAPAVESDAAPESNAQDDELPDSATEPSEEDTKPAISEKQKHDPLRWFGVFVPQALRTSQKHFTESLGVIVNELSSVDSRMKALEIEIRRAKKQLSKLK